MAAQAAAGSVSSCGDAVSDVDDLFGEDDEDTRLGTLKTACCRAACVEIRTRGRADTFAVSRRVRRAAQGSTG